ncbi:MAG TPA: alpha-glucosidase/alpha-galactosidase [Chloroflexota bacterium]|nr:alpha-glucosidase/alpha-galactosidase [Chloroflexota bacterium]
MPRSLKISVIGAGSGVFSLGLVKDLCLNDNLRESQVTFMDLNRERLEIVHRLAGRYAEELGSAMQFETTTDREAALRDADFVINTASPVSHHAQRRERELADEYGYYYGGTNLHAPFAQFDLMLSVARDVERICPNAWLIQSGNPVFDGCTLLHRETNAKVIGLCHGHYGYLDICKVLGLDPTRVTWEAPGLNHCIWLTEFRYDGQDAYPLLEAWIEREGEEYWRTHVADRTHDKQMSRGSIHQYRMYGLMPIGDTPRTQAQTCNWWHHTDLATKKRWFGEPFGGPDTEIARPFYVANLEKRIQQMGEVSADPKARVADVFGSVPTREQHVPIIDALANNVEGRFQVNWPNRGIVDGIPDDVVAEFRAIIDATGVHPLKPTPLPRKIMLEVIFPFWLDMERTLEAYRTGDRSMLLWNVLQSHQTRSYEQAVDVLQALMNDPEHAALAARYQGFDGTGDRWKAPAPAPAATPTAV